MVGYKRCFRNVSPYPVTASSCEAINSRSGAPKNRNSDISQVYGVRGPTVTVRPSGIWNVRVLPAA
jgi:hypothetical protein